MTETATLVDIARLLEIKVAELERQLTVVQDLNDKHHGYWKDAEKLLAASTDRVEKEIGLCAHWMSQYADSRQEVAQLSDRVVDLEKKLAQTHRLLDSSAKEYNALLASQARQEPSLAEHVEKNGGYVAMKVIAPIVQEPEEEDATFKRHLSEHQITSRDEPITAQEGHLGPHPNYDPKTSVSPYTEITSLAAEAATQDTKLHRAWKKGICRHFQPLGECPASECTSNGVKQDE